jgi:hypothetical protein
VLENYQIFNESSDNESYVLINTDLDYSNYGLVSGKSTGKQNLFVYKIIIATLCKCP